MQSDEHQTKNGTREAQSSAGNPSVVAGARIGGWLKSKAASLEGHVKEMRENSKLIAVEGRKVGEKLQETLTASRLVARPDPKIDEEKMTSKRSSLK